MQKLVWGTRLVAGLLFGAGVPALLFSFYYFWGGDRYISADGLDNLALHAFAFGSAGFGLLRALCVLLEPHTPSLILQSIVCVFLPTGVAISWEHYQFWIMNEGSLLQGSADIAATLASVFLVFFAHVLFELLASSNPPRNFGLRQ